MTCILAYKEKLPDGKFRVHMASDSRVSSDNFIISDTEKKIWRVNNILFSAAGKAGAVQYIRDMIADNMQNASSAYEAATYMQKFARGDSYIKNLLESDECPSFCLGASDGLFFIGGNVCITENTIMGFGVGSNHAEGAFTAMLPFVESGQLAIEDAMRRAVRISYKFVLGVGGEVQYETIC